MSLNKTDGIVLRTIKYGESSLIAAIYTQLFGLQHYMIKGVRKGTQKRPATANCFQPGAILDLVVYHNTLKELHYIREYQWKYLYRQVYFDVAKNAVLTYCVELLDHTLGEPEPSPAFYAHIEELFRLLDTATAKSTALFPLHFTLMVIKTLGYQIQQPYFQQEKEISLPVLKKENPQNISLSASLIKKIGTLEEDADWEKESLTRMERRELLHYFQQYLAQHINNFKALKSLPILQTILN